MTSRYSIYNDFMISMFRGKVSLNTNPKVAATTHTCSLHALFVGYPKAALVSYCGSLDDRLGGRTEITHHFPLTDKLQGHLSVPAAFPPVVCSVGAEGEARTPLRVLLKASQPLRGQWLHKHLQPMCSKQWQEQVGCEWQWWHFSKNAGGPVPPHLPPMHCSYLLSSHPSFHFEKASTSSLHLGHFHVWEFAAEFITKILEMNFYPSFRYPSLHL